MSKRDFLLALFSFLVILNTSCRTEGNMMVRYREQFRPGTNSSFAQLKSGQRVSMTPGQLTDVQLNPQLPGANKTIALDDTTVRIADVQSFVMPGLWASLAVDYKGRKITGTSYSLMEIHAPRLNYYAGTYDASGTAIRERNSNTRFYLQAGDSGKLQRFSYETMRGFVPRSSPASPYLMSYRKHKTVNNAVRWLGFGSMVAGIAMLSTGHPVVGRIGLATVPVGLGVLIAGGTGQSKNIKNRLHRAYYLYNGMEKP